MHTTNLRKVGGSVMLSVPPAILDLLHLKAGSIGGLEVDGDRLVIATQMRPHYMLDDLLAQCDADAPLPEEDREWIGLPPMGREL